MRRGDTGLTPYLPEEPESGGAHPENLVLGDLVAWRDTQIPHPQLLYWRTASGEEVDFVIERQRELLPIEVKATARPGHRDARHLRTFCDEYPDRVRGGLLLHVGEEVFWVSRGILAAPWSRVM